MNLQATQDLSRASSTELLNAPPNQGRGHAVQFYETEQFLARVIGDFIFDGAEAGEPTIVVATKEHCALLERELASRGCDPARAIQAGELELYDAEEVLASLFVNGLPHRERFNQHIRSAVRAARARNGERPLRAFGEMDLLWKRGNVEGALALEALWTELALIEEIRLVCGYAMDNFRSSAHAGGFELVCDRHTHVSPTESFAKLGDDESRRRTVARLEQRARSLEAEITRRERIEEMLLEQVRLNETLAHTARHAETAAEEEREKLRQLFMQSPALIMILRGPDHVVDFVNSGAARLIASSGAVLGRPLAEVVPDLSAEQKTIHDHVLTTGHRHIEDAVSTTRDWNGDGRRRERFFNMVYEPYRGATGRVEGLMVFGFEVTDQVLAKRRIEAVAEELETANRTKDEFLAAVSHELRTPLNAILGWVRMLRSDVLPTQEKRARALEVIERNAHVQTQLVEDLLDVSRIVSGKPRLDVTTVDLPAVLENAIEAVRPAATAKGVRLRQTLDPRASPILGDANRLQQVVWNLLTNAVKFTPRGGSVRVALQRRDSSTEIIVADSGEGISREFLPHVFDRFRQADATTTRKHGGLGLGLTIVRSLVELHGGTVAVESDGPGRGAVFTVCLPISPLRSSTLERPPPIRPTPSSELRTDRALEGIHVLVVDDEPDARELLAQLLTASSKAIVTTSATVAEAIQRITERRPHVVVSDIGMPGEDGYDLIRKLRALPASEGGRTPAVALTAYARVEDRTKALIAGFNMHVPKPVEPAELLAILSSLVTLFSPLTAQELDH